MVGAPDAAPQASAWSLLASSAWTVVLGLLSGAGGSVLLELYWKPRRDRHRAANLLLAEVALNTQLLILHAHNRVAAPRVIPADLRLSTMAWDATAPLISELPAKLLRKVVTLYNRYDSLNRLSTLFGDALEKAEGAPPLEMMRHNALINATLDAFNTGADAALADGQHVLKELMTVAGWTETAEERAQVVDYAKAAAEHMQAREERLRGSS